MLFGKIYDGDRLKFRATRGILEISILNATILGSGLLINSTASLADAEATFKMYKMLGCATISLQIAGRQTAGGEG